MDLGLGSTRALMEGFREVCALDHGFLSRLILRSDCSILRTASKAFEPLFELTANCKS